MEKRTGLDNFKTFTFRALNGLSSFIVTDTYIYAVNTNGIYQIKKMSNRYIQYRCEISPVVLCGDSLRLIITTKDSIFLFDKELRFLGEHFPLSLQFLCVFLCEGKTKNYLFSVSEERLSIYSLDDVIEKQNIVLDSRNGLCSSIFVNGSSVYFGFESGKIYKLKFNIRTSELYYENCSNRDNAFGRKNLDKYCKDNRTNLFGDNEMLCANSPILSIHVTESYIVYSTYDKIVHLQGTENYYTKIPDRILKIISYSNIIILKGNDALYFTDEMLRIFSIYRISWECIDIYVDETILYIGYSNGLICSYDISAFKNSCT